MKLTVGFSTLFFAGMLSAGTVSYDLVSDFSSIHNPNGQWTYAQGTTALPAFVQAGQSECFYADQPGWMPSANKGNCLPAFVQVTGNDEGYYEAGDILVHSWDPTNGGDNGEAYLYWTAPETGVITFSGSIWYAHNVDSTHGSRSNEFALGLGDTVLATGTVDPTHMRDNQILFSSDGLSLTGSFAVTAGDKLYLTVTKSEGQLYGSMDGITLSITETGVGPQIIQNPEPGTVLMFFGAGAVLFAYRKRR